MNFFSALRNLFVVAAIFTSMGASAASIYVRDECSATTPCGYQSTLQQNGPSTPIDVLVGGPDLYVIRFDLAYVNDSFVITALSANTYGDSIGNSGYYFAIFDGSQPIIYATPEDKGNAIGIVDVFNFPRDPAIPFVLALPSAVPEAKSSLLTLIGFLGLSMVCLSKRRSMR